MTKDEKSTDTKQASNSFPFPLVVTPEKLEIPSSGHLDVEIKNPTNQPLKVDCDFDSFNFNIARVWYLKDGKEIDVPVKSEFRREYSHILDIDDVLHIRIKCEDKFDSKVHRYYDEYTKFGYLSVSCVSKFDSKTFKPKQEQSDCGGFELKARNYFMLSMDPKCEIDKAIAEKYKEQQRYQERREKVSESRHSKEGWWISEYVEEAWECETDNQTRVRKWNAEILAKYGAKLDQMSIADISKIKEDMLKAYEKEEKEERRKKKRQEMKDKMKKCVVM